MNTLSKRAELLFFTFLSLSVSFFVVVLLQRFSFTVELTGSNIEWFHKAASEDLKGLSPLERKAARLESRLEAHDMYVPSRDKLMTAIKERQDLLKKSVVVNFVANGTGSFAPWAVSTSRYPLFISFESTRSTAHFFLDESRIESHIQDLGIEGISGPVNAQILQVKTENKGVMRAVTTGIAKTGYTFDAKKVSEQLYGALSTGTPDLTLELTEAQGRFVNNSGMDLGELTLLSVGRSNFAGSGGGRIANVRKGLGVNLHNVVIAPGEAFSFNSILGNVTIDAGWQMALAIFNGHDLTPVPGGGICQVATTLYRAILHGGFPVIARAGHSLFVVYYEKYGLGMDATVYPGTQDLVFRNDSPSYLLIQSYTDGFDATVNVYGTPDGRVVKLDGPYLTGNAPAGADIRKNQVYWYQHVESASGQITNNTYVSTYNEGIPKKIQAKYKKEPTVVAENQ